jgi:molybdate transport system substrate-binding protein
MTQTKRTLLRAVGAGAMLLGSISSSISIAISSSTPSLAQGNDVVVFAAASLKNALDAVAAAWQKETGSKVTISYGASPALAKQIEQDAPAHIFIAADLDWMDYVASKKLIRLESRANLLGNRIVLIVPRDKRQTLEIKPGFDLAKILGDGRLAIANVQSVPAGKYGKAALEKLGVWSSVAGKLAQTENVRAALLLVSRGEAAAGIVYQTDAASDAGVTIAGTFPEDTHPAIVYPIALTAKATAPAAAAFLAYVRGQKAKAVYDAEGFTFINQTVIN